MLDATCCNVDVEKGASGFLVAGFFEISEILNFLFLMSSTIFFVSFSFLKLNFSTLLPSTEIKLAFI